MSSKTESKIWDLKAAKKLFQEYLKKSIEEKKKEVKLPENTVKIDNLNKQQTLERIYKLTDSLIDMIYENGRPSIKLPSRSSIFPCVAGKARYREPAQREPAPRYFAPTYLTLPRRMQVLGCP